MDSMLFFSSRRRHTRCALVDWSSDVCSSDLPEGSPIWRRQDLISAAVGRQSGTLRSLRPLPRRCAAGCPSRTTSRHRMPIISETRAPVLYIMLNKARSRCPAQLSRSEEHTSELQSLMRLSYAVFCLKKKKKQQLSIQC